MPALSALLDIGYVGKDYEELIAVLFTTLASLGILVGLGWWWQR
jgi:hypothetical protein